jgi:hypothetical protein
MKRIKCNCFCVPRKAKARSATLHNQSKKHLTQSNKTTMFTRIPSDMVRDISAFLDASSLGSMSTASSTIHSDLVQVMKTRLSEYLNRPPTEVDENGTKIWRDDEGELHRINGPAMIEANGDETWFYHGWIDREDGPAMIMHDNSGNRIREEWRWNDQLHRKDGPAVIIYNKDGIRIREEWWIRNKLHRKDAPAVKHFEVYEFDEWSDDNRYNENGEWHSDDWRGDLSQEWWNNGVQLFGNDMGCIDNYSSDDEQYNVWWSDCFSE